MTEPQTAQPTPAEAAPKRTCEKCRIAYGPEAFTHQVEACACICDRCMKVMGYKL